MYFHHQNVEKCKNDKIVTFSFPKFVSFYHCSVPEELWIPGVFFAILMIKILIGSRKGVFYLYENWTVWKIASNQDRFFISSKKRLN